MPTSHPHPPAEDRPDTWDWLQRLQAHYGRFARDFGALLLILLATLLLLALASITEGDLLTPLTNTLRRWTGWGASIPAILLFLAGVNILVNRQSPQKTWQWGQFIAFEAFFFAALAGLAALGGVSIERAEAGLDGGYIGWAIATLLTMRLGSLASNLLIALSILLTATLAFGLLEKLELLLWKIAGQQPIHIPGADALPGLEPTPRAGTDSPEPPAAIPEESAPATKRPAPIIPPEFRKNFKVDEQKDEKPAAPLERGENLPPLGLLFGDQNARPDERHINQTAGLIEKTLSEFGIPAKVVGFRVGPTVTQFAVQPGFIKKPGANTEEDAQMMKVRVAQIAGLQKDLALALSAQRLRIEAPVPGRSYVGIEVPNNRASVVRLRPILESDTFHKAFRPLSVALGRDVSGQPVIADLARMPHLLVAGQTGSGKSVCIASLAACLAMNNSPADLRLVMIDAKMVELLRFNGLPHLFGKVETDVQRILGVLRWVVLEMENRYRLLESARARDLDSYNAKMRARKDGQAHLLPRLVVIIDELADLMMSAPDQTEHNLVRLAQMARATGIHLIVATQRPSTDVVTGLIKANFPARLAFAVASGIDSRVILDTPGAETLLGRGDMLFLHPEVGTPTRAQGVLVTDQEIERIIAFWQKAALPASDTPPWETLLQEPAEGSEDALLEKAIQIVRSSQRANASLIQRKLKIGYPRAARLLDQLEEMGIVGPSQGGGKERDVLVDREDGDDELDD